MMQTVNRRLAAGALGLALLWPFAAGAQAPAKPEEPKYGGTLEIATIFPTLSALSWDHKDYPWKINHDAGTIYEQLLVADLSKAKKNGGPYTFKADAWIPTDAIKGELAESWEIQDNPLAVVIKLRKGIMFAEKPGIMKAREVTADDVVFSHYYRHNSPRRQAGLNEEITKVAALDRYTVAYYMTPFLADWPYRIGYGYNSSIMPKEVVDAGASDWKNVTGSGPFMIADYKAGNSQTYTKNASYWDKETIAGTEYKLPFADQVVYRIIRDDSTRLTAFRTGKLDILETVNWQNLEELKKSNPQIKHNTWVNPYGTFLAMRLDAKPFDDVRVRRALNMAVNKEEIVKSYYNGNAELFAYPMHPDYDGYFEPLSAMPDSVKELFKYDPAKAKKLLAEAGYPNGFTFKVQVTTASSEHMDLLPLISAYLEQVGVKLEIQTMEYAAFLSAMTTRTHGPGYFMNNGHSNPLTSIRKSFITGQRWNPSGHSDPAYDEKMKIVDQERDEDKRKVLIKEMTREILDKAPYIWLPTVKYSTVWWPWVKNYDGELTAGAVRPGPIYARIWIDQDMKKKMGF